MTPRAPFASSKVMFLRDPAWLALTLPEKMGRFSVRCGFEVERKGGVGELHTVSPVRAAACEKCPAEAEERCDGDCDFEGGTCRARAKLRTLKGELVDYV